MIRLFNVEREREILRGPVGIQRSLDLSFDEYLEANALSRSAHSMLLLAIESIIVGFDSEARALLTKAIEWLEHAVQTGERNRDYFQYGTEAWRHETLAMCNWLLSDENDQQNLDESMRLDALYNAANKRDKGAISLDLPSYLDASHYLEALTLYEKFWGEKRPKNIKRISSEAAMAYVVAAGRLRGEYSPEQITAAGEKFLFLKMNAFLNGHSDRAARWLKILHWNEAAERLSAFETVRRCYDYLPDVQRPKFANH